MLAVLSVAIGYALGSIPFAFILARWWGHIDLRRSGSGNVGAANVFRTTGPIVGLSALILDLAKGAATVLLAQRLGAGPVWPTAAGIAAVLGHIYPIWLRFRGGRGVATAGGVFAVLAPVATAIACVIFIATVWWTRYVSLGSIVATVLLGPIAYLADAPRPVVIGALITGVIVVQRHLPNLIRLLAGAERRIGHEEVVSRQ